jgi:hypothetical protein
MERSAWLPTQAIPPPKNIQSALIFFVARILAQCTSPICMSMSMSMSMSMPRCRRLSVGAYGLTEVTGVSCHGSAQEDEEIRTKGYGKVRDQGAEVRAA